MPNRPGQSADQQADAQYTSNANTAFYNGQGDLTQAKQDMTNLRSGKMAGADPYLNPTYLAAVNQLRSGALNQQNNSADQQIRALNNRTGGMNSTATTGAIANLAGNKMRLGNELGAQQTASDWTKNIGYQLQLPQTSIEAANAQGKLYGTATQGQGDALKNLTQFGLASYGPWESAISALGGAAGAALAPWTKAMAAGSGGGGGGGGAGV